MCLKNAVEVEKRRFCTLDKGAFEGNLELYCPKKTCRTGVKSCLFSPISIFKTHSKGHSSISDRSKPVRRDLFSDQDLRILQFEFRKIPADAFHDFLAINGILCALIGTGYRFFSGILERYDIWEVVMIMISLSAGIILLSFGNKRRLLKKDLKGGIKLIQKREVVEKQKSFSSGKFWVWIETGKKLKKFEVDHSLYSRLQIGQLVAFEYAPYSKIELKTHWY